MFIENLAETEASKYPTKLIVTLGVRIDANAPLGFQYKEDYIQRTIFSKQRPIKIGKCIYFEQLSKLYEIIIHQKIITQYVSCWDFRVYNHLLGNDITENVKEMI